jgi:hypothetical protein
MPVSLFVCILTRQVQLAPLKLIRPGGVWLDLATRLQHFPWNGAELWLALERARGRSNCHQNRRNKGKDFMFDCTATGCHPNLKPGSTIVALLCGDSRTTW